MDYKKFLIPLILFFVVSNPILYRLMSKLPVIGSKISSPTGRPTQFGVVVHSIVFVLVGVLVAKLNRSI